MQLIFKPIDEHKHDTFVISSNQTSILQSTNWQQIKSNWSVAFFGVFDQNHTQLASISVYTRPLFLHYTMIYVPHGPVITSHLEERQEKHVWTTILDNLKKYAKQQHSLWITIDPKYSLNHSKTSELVSILSNFVATDNWKWSGRTESLDETINPRVNAIVTRDSLNTLSSKTLSRIKAAKKKLIIKHGNYLNDFNTLMQLTEDRKNISLRNYIYYKKLLETYNGYITIAYLDINSEINSAENQKYNLQKRLNALPESSKKYDNITTELNVVISRLNFLREQRLKLKASSYFKNEELIPLAATLTINYGDTSENLYAGANGEFTRYNAALLTWYENLLYTFETYPHIKYQNLGGVEPLLDGGLYKFKHQLSPEIIENIGEFTYPTHILYKPFQWLLSIRKHMKSKKKER